MALFSRVSEQYGELVNFIIRPPRDDGYTERDLGPPTFALARKVFKRTDLELINRRNQRLQCSHYEPTDKYRVQEKLPCVVYLHGNCSSRVEALGTLPVLLPQDITVFAFDFSGSGKSEGNYVSLGWWEREDLDVVIEHLRATGRVSTIGLWGRSMGAVTALLHADRDPSIGGMVLDSPFSSLRRLAEELASVVVAWKLPRFVLNSLLGMVRTTIINKASFDINNLAPIDHVGHTFIPALFIVANEDTFILPSHGEELYSKYAGDRNILHVAGDHNSVRPRFLNDSAAIFFHTCLTVQALRAAGKDGEDRSIKCVSLSPFSLFPVDSSHGRGRRGDDTAADRRRERGGRTRRDSPRHDEFTDAGGRQTSLRSTESDSVLTEFERGGGVDSRRTSATHRNRSAPTDRAPSEKGFCEVSLLSQDSSLSSLGAGRLRSRQTSLSPRRARDDGRSFPLGRSGEECGSSASSSAAPWSCSRGRSGRSGSLFPVPRSLWHRHSSSSSTQLSEQGREKKELKSSKNAVRSVASAFRWVRSHEDPEARGDASGERRTGEKKKKGVLGLFESDRSARASRESDAETPKREDGQGGHDADRAGLRRARGEDARERDDLRASTQDCSDLPDGSEAPDADRRGYGLLNNGHGLNEMRRPEAAWGFYPDDHGALRFLAADGNLEDEDEIVQRAVALSLEEYLASQRRSQSRSLSGEEGPGSSSSRFHASQSFNETEGDRSLSRPSSTGFGGERAARKPDPQPPRVGLQSGAEAEEAAEAAGGSQRHGEADSGKRRLFSFGASRGRNRDDGWSRSEGTRAQEGEAAERSGAGSAPERASGRTEAAVQRGDGARASSSVRLTPLVRSSETHTQPPLSASAPSSSSSSPPCSAAGGTSPASLPPVPAVEAGAAPETATRASLGRSSFSRPVFSFSFSKKTASREKTNSRSGG